MRTNRVRLTKGYCDKAEYQGVGERADYRWDAMVPGFGLRVYPSGRKAWVATYRTLGGRQRWVQLADYLHLTLEQARAEALKLFGAKAAGEDDPAAPRRRKAEALTCAKLVELYLAHAATRKKTWRKDAQVLAFDFLPRFGPLPASTITRADVKTMLDAVSRRAPIGANRLLAYVRRMFNWAVDEDLLPASPAARIKPPAVERPKDRVLSPEELAALWTALPPSETGRALRVILATAQRPGEVLGMRWEEIEGNWWTLPAARHKSGRGHRAWLNETALALLGHRKTAGAVLVLKQGIGTATLSQAAKKFCDSSLWKFPAFTPHDLRRTAATNLGALGVSRTVIGAVLGHADRSVTAIYDRHTYDREKQEAMEAWARRLHELVRR